MLGLLRAEGGLTMGCYFWGDDEYRECDDCPYFSECDWDYDEHLGPGDDLEIKDQEEDWSPSGEGDFEED